MSISIRSQPQGTIRNSDAQRSELVGLRQLSQTGNGCGTCSMAMALSHILGYTVTQRQLDLLARRGDIFTSPEYMRYAADQNGVAARMVNNMTQEEVVAALGARRPICFLSDMSTADPSDIAELHWRVLDGYRYASDGTLELHVVDPNGFSDWQAWDHLCTTWSSVQALDVDTGFNRFGIVLGASTSDTDLGEDRVAGCRTAGIGSDVVATVTNVGADTLHISAALWREARGLVPPVSKPLRAIQRMLRRK